MKVVNILAMMLLVVCFVFVGCSKEPSSVPIPTESGDVENQGDTDKHPEGTDADGNPVEGDEGKGTEEADPEEEADPAKEEEAAPAKEEAAAPAAVEAKKE